MNLKKNVFLFCFLCFCSTVQSQVISKLTKLEKKEKYKQIMLNFEENLAVNYDTTLFITEKYHQVAFSTKKSILEEGYVVDAYRNENEAVFFSPDYYPTKATLYATKKNVGDMFLFGENATDRPRTNEYKSIYGRRVKSFDFSKSLANKAYLRCFGNAKGNYKTDTLVSNINFQDSIVNEKRMIFFEVNHEIKFTFLGEPNNSGSMECGERIIIQNKQTKFLIDPVSFAILYDEHKIQEKEKATGVNYVRFSKCIYDKIGEKYFLSDLVYYAPRAFTYDACYPYSEKMYTYIHSRKTPIDEDKFDLETKDLTKMNPKFTWLDIIEKSETIASPTKEMEQCLTEALALKKWLDN